jgi:hypothetical protein
LFAPARRMPGDRAAWGLVDRSARAGRPPGLELSRPSEHSTDEGEKLVARAKAHGLPRVQVRDPGRLADPVAPSAVVELDDEDVVARETGPFVGVVVGSLVFFTCVSMFSGAVVRAIGESYGHRRLAARAERLRLQRATVCSGLVSVRTGPRPP